MEKIIPSCSLCQNYDSLRRKCNVLHDFFEESETIQATQCKENGNFIRNLNVLPDFYNVFADPNNVPLGWKPDTSRLPMDENGKPLVVITERGYERALPAYPEVVLKCDGHFENVPRYTTYQGQREMVYQLGYGLAKRVIEEKGYELHTLPGEESYKGKPEYMRHYCNKQGKDNQKHVLLNNEPNRLWEDLHQLEAGILMEELTIINGMLHFGTNREKQRAKRLLIEHYEPIVYRFIKQETIDLAHKELGFQFLIGVTICNLI